MMPVEHRPTPQPANRGYGPGGGVTRLTATEQRVIDAIIEHGSNAAAARVLGIGESTVKNHTSSILDKLDVDSITQAAVLWDRFDRSTKPFDRRRGERRLGGELRAATPTTSTVPRDDAACRHWVLVPLRREGRKTVDEMTAEAMLVSGDAVACQHCKPLQELPG